MRAPRGLFVLLLLLGLSVAVAPATPSDTPRPFSPRTVAAVSWPPSTGLFISEVQTGGASASDEFVELWNGGPASVDLEGLELVGVSSSGATVARRVAWTSPVVVEPGRHVLLANAAGVWASIADATYATGLAATGGAVVLRPVGGSPIDAVAWGDAVNAFVEGSAAAAPPVGSSIERRPGGPDGNGIDTNDNASDWVVRALPGPQRLADAPVSALSPSPTPSLSPSPIPTAAASPSPVPPPSPSPTPSPVPSASPSPAPSVPATASPPPSLDATRPIAQVRSLPNGAPAALQGVLTTALGALDGGRGAFVQDGTGGIALYVDPPASQAWPAGTVIRAAGSVDRRYGLTALRVAVEGLQPGGTARLPASISITTGGAGASLEGLRVTVAGRVVDAPSPLADGIGLSVDDGSGVLRVIIDPNVLGAVFPARGCEVTATGPLGRRDGSTGPSFRVHATTTGSVTVVVPAASPSPGPSPSQDPTPAPPASASPPPSPAPGVTPRPTEALPTPSPSPPPAAVAVDTVPIATAGSLAAGQRVRVHGLVTAAPGLLWTPRVAAIQDATGGIFVRLRRDDVPPAIGSRIVVDGTLVAIGGRLELRADVAVVTIPDAGPSSETAPEPIDPGGSVDPADDALLTSIAGRVVSPVRRGTDGRVSFAIEAVSGARIGITATGAAAVPASDVVAGAMVRVVGVAVAPRTRSGARPGRIWLRTAADVQSVDFANVASPRTGGTGPRSTPEIGRVTTGSGAAVTVTGVVTVPPGILAPRGRLIRIEDPTGSIEVLLSSSAGAGDPSVKLAIGTRVVVVGRVVRTASGLRIHASEVRVDGTGSSSVAVLAGAPAPSDVGRIVRISGTVLAVRGSGTAWRAELGTATGRAVVIGVAGAGIRATRLLAGAAVRVVGLVEMAASGAVDRRPRVVPRRPQDVTPTGVAGTAVATAPVAPSAGSGAGATTAAAVAPEASGSAPAAAVPHRTSADLRREPPGADPVAVSGVVRGIVGETLFVEDGAGLLRIAFAGPAAEIATNLAVGTALRAVGRVVEGADPALVRVDDAAAVVRAGALVTSAAFPTIASATVDAQDAGASTDGARTGASASFGAGASPAPALGDVADPAASPSILGAGVTSQTEAPLPAVAILVVLGASIGTILLIEIRRRRARAALSARVAARVARLAGTPSRAAAERPGLVPALDAHDDAGLSSPPFRARPARRL